VHGRPDADRFRVRGCIEEGTTDALRHGRAQQASRYRLVMGALNNARRTPSGTSDLKAWCQAKLAEHEAYVVANLEDMPEVRDWVLADSAEKG
jgi:xylulose-5-phosphate/fructose-6-phosphate phosphoketolase